MSSQEIDIEKLNEEYPCDQRDGYAVLTKCKCKGPDGQPRVEKRMIKCKLKDKNIKWEYCICCPYQKEKVSNK